MLLKQRLCLSFIALMWVPSSHAILGHRTRSQNFYYPIPAYEKKTHLTDVDHFSFTSSAKYNMTYLISTINWKSGGPILFYTGNEGSIEHFAQNTGFMFELAANLSGVVIFAEHRFYGSSMPFGSKSFLDYTHFGYLTAEQALADFAKFLTDFKCSNRQFEKSPVISFGGSYGGMLTAWFRQTYPNLVAAGLAASAPIWLFPGMADCKGFMRVATKAYEKAGGEACTSTIREVWALIDEIANKPNGMEDLSTLFKTCRPIPSSKFLNDFAQDYLVTLAMGNYPYSTSFLGELPAWPVKEFCKAMARCPTQGKLPTQVEKFACAFFSLYNYKHESECLSFGDQDVNLNASGWELQTCMEMTNPICADGKQDMFKPTSWNPVEFSNTCQERFGVRPRMDWAGTRWWARDISTATRLIFSNGDLDPWSAFGVQENSFVTSGRDGVAVEWIRQGAHHLDLRGAHPNDTVEVRAARRRIRDRLVAWAAAWRTEHHPLYCLDF